jgi:hypothetical protein
MAQQGGAPGFATPTGPTTGSPWEQNMMQQMGGAQNPQDQLLQQQLMKSQMAAGQGPQMQGLGRPAWQSIADVGQAMGSIPTDATGGAPGNAAARSSGYAAYRPGAMGQLARQNPQAVQPREQTKWMARK